MTSTNYRYDVALSFAGEDRLQAEALAIVLKSYGLRVFYDLWESDKLWGENLYDYLAIVYSTEAQYCVVFISENYAEKLWPNHERRSAQARAFREKEAYVLPIRLDSTEIPGIPETIGYVDMRSGDITPTEVAYLLVRKLGRDVREVDADPVAYVRSVVKKVLCWDEDSLYFHHGQYDEVKWSRHRDILRNTIFMIASYGDAVVPEIASVLDGTSNRFLKRNLLKVLEAIGSPRATESVSRAANDADAKVRNLAILALRTFRDESAIPTLIAAIQDRDTYVRRNAVVALKSLARESLAPVFMDVVEHDEDEFIQAHAVEGLRAVGTAVCLDFIRGLRGHPSEYVREATEKALREELEEL